MADTGPLLQVEDLRVEFRTSQGLVRAVNGVSFELDASETLAILGESGSGKSVTAQALMGLVRSPPGHVEARRMSLAGLDLRGLDRSQWRSVRGTRIAMVFQDALSSLTPTLTIGWQIAEMLRAHRGASKHDAYERAVELMDRVGIPSPRERLKDYPHQFSGGMRQRAMLAIALALEPEVLIADEPTTALDVTVQAQVIELIVELQEQASMGVIFISHDLGVVSEVADKVAIMYAGRFVETGRIDEVYRSPRHPYTEALLGSRPRLFDETRRLTPIPGAPPDLAELPPGCAFHPRCPYADEVCVDLTPAMEPAGAGRFAACHFPR